MIVPAYLRRVVSLEIFMTRKFGMGFLGVKFWSREFFGFLFEAPGILLGFHFCPHSFIPVTWNPDKPPLQAGSASLFTKELNKFTNSCQTNMSPKHYSNRYIWQKSSKPQLQYWHRFQVCPSVPSLLFCCIINTFSEILSSNFYDSLKFFGSSYFLNLDI